VWVGEVIWPQQSNAPASLPLLPRRQTVYNPRR